MKSNSIPVVPVLARQFYQENATLFLIALLLAGGFMRGEDHLALASYFVGSSTFLLIPFSIWLLYAGYVARFCYTSLKKPENTFLTWFACLSPQTQWTSCLAVAITQLVPIWFYGAFLTIVAVRDGSVDFILPIIVVVIALVFIMAFLTRFWLNHPDFEVRPNRLTSGLYKRVRRPFVWWIVEAALRQQLLQLFLLKIAGLALLSAALFLYGTDTYDIRLAGIAIVFSFALNNSFLNASHGFINHHFNLYRQMPFSLARRYGHILRCIIVFNLPELAILIRNSPDDFSFYDPVMLFITGISINVMIYCYLFTKMGNYEKALKFVYFIIIVTFFAVLGNVALWLIASVYTIASIWLFRSGYYRFELLSDQA